MKKSLLRIAVEDEAMKREFARMAGIALNRRGAATDGTDDEYDGIAYGWHQATDEQNPSVPSVKSVAEKPFGWEVDVLICPFMVQLESNSTTLTLHYRGSKSSAQRRAMMKPHACKIAAIRPVTEAEWRAAYGNPEERGL